MKKTLSLVLIVLVTATSFAQENRRGDKKERPNRTEKREHFKSFYSDLTPDQLADLKTKKMALALDLTNAQQKDILSLNKEMATKRKEKMKAWKAKKDTAEKQKPTSDELYAMMNERLDAQLAEQNTMKKILNDDQYETWKKSKNHMHDKFRKHMYGKRR